MVPRWPSAVWTRDSKDTLPKTWVTLGRYLVPFDGSQERRRSPYDVRATQIMPMFVVRERYLTGKNSNQDFMFAIYKLEQKLGIPVNNKQRSFLCHQSCSAASTLWRRTILILPCCFRSKLHSQWWIFRVVRRSLVRWSWIRWESNDSGQFPTSDEGSMDDVYNRT